MKAKILILPIGLLLFILGSGFSHQQNNAMDDAPRKNSLVIPENVQNIIQTSCYGCHNAESKSEKGRAKLQFDSLDTLAVAKLVGKLGEISDEVSENKMPPAKFLEFKPEAKLTTEQKDALVKWANSAADSLLKK